MGAEALSKVSRRDIRRAFSPEASAEVFRFVEHTEKALEDRCVGIERAVTAATEGRVAQAETVWAQALFDARQEIQTVEDAHATRINALVAAVGAMMFRSTFRQRLRWLLRGVWP